MTFQSKRRIGGATPSLACDLGRTRAIAHNNQTTGSTAQIDPRTSAEITMQNPGRNTQARRNRVAKKRSLRFESLETRHLLAGSIDSQSVHMDVSNDGVISALDALQIVNEVRRESSSSAFDVNGDGQVTAGDALVVINHLSEQTSNFNIDAETFGQSSGSPSATTTLPNEVREREVVEFSVDSITDLPLAEINALLIDWGDGRTDQVPNHLISLPLLRYHQYFGTKGVIPISVVADTDAGTILLSSDTIDVVNNSPSVTDRVGQGFTAEVFGNANFSGQVISRRIDPTIAFDFGEDGPDPRLNIAGNRFSIRWSGDFLPDYSGEHRIFTTTTSNDEVRVFVDGTKVIDTFGNASAGEQLGVVNWTEGVAASIVVEYASSPGLSAIRVNMENDQSFKTLIPGNRTIPLTVTADIRTGALVEHFPVSPGDGITELRDSNSFENNTPTSGADSAEFRFLDSANTTQGTRIRSILRAPVSGTYRFHLASSGPAELWFAYGKTSDTSQRIASVSTSTPPEAFDDAEAGVSTDILLIAGQEYYLELLSVHDNGSEPGHASVGWVRPDSVLPTAELIGGTDIRPIVPEVTISADVSQTHESDSVSSDAFFVVSRSDDLGRALNVHYTLGGTATNGIDYVSMSGTTLIPAGQSSVRVRVEPLTDSVVDPFESVVVRLVSDTAYQLGLESERQITIGIHGEIDGGVSLLPSNIVDTYSLGFTSGEPNNTFTTFEETAPDLPFVNSPGSANALRVTASSFANPWDVLLGFGFDDAVIPDGSTLFASVWARGTAADGSVPTMGIRVQELSSNYAGIENQFDIPSEWTPVVWPVVADFDGSVDNRSIDIRFGFKEQTIELAGFQLIRLDSPPPLANLPSMIFSYDGRNHSATWRQDVADEAATVRSKPSVLSVVSSDGTPAPGIAISVSPQNNGLPIGNSVSPELIVPESDPATQTPDNLRYQSILRNYFDVIVDAGSGQWGPWSQSQSRPTEFLRWADEIDVDYHGHAIVWGLFSNSNFPTPSDLLSGYNQQVAAFGPLVAADWLKSEILDHIEINGPANSFSR